MRVAGRTLVFGVLIYGLLAPTASASPILGADSIGCTAVLTAPTTNCALLGIDPFAPGTISGEFEFLNDVALFSFTLTGDTMFSAHTTSFAATGFDSTFALFNAGGNRSMVAFPDGSQFARSADINADPDNPNYDDALAPFLLGGGDYILALVMYPNDFRQAPDFGLTDSLLAGFQSDGAAPESCGAACGFSLRIDATPSGDGPPAPVPEPGTLVLLGSGAVAAFIRKRSKKNA
jgi:hypothetical protein